MKLCTNCLFPDTKQELKFEEFLQIYDKFTNKKIFRTNENGKIFHDEEGNVQKLSMQ